jgi:hypothetical protein
VRTGPGDENAAGASGCGHLRASRADREQVIATLKAAFVQGRLAKDELDLRVGQALASRTVAELTALTADLPAGLVKAQQWPKAARVKARPLVSKVVTASACVILAAATLGMLAGIAVTLSRPAVFRSSALVVLPTSAARLITTQVVIAGSDPVLTGAMHQLDQPTSLQGLQNLGQATSLQALQSSVQVASLSPTIISIGARGETAALAVDTANAVANSYVDYLSSAKNPGLRMQARIFQPAVGATTKPLPARLLALSGLGALYGALIGAVSALAFTGVWQHSRRAGKAPADHSA